jgi:hypothetical protein
MQLHFPPIHYINVSDFENSQRFQKNVFNCICVSNYLLGFRHALGIYTMFLHQARFPLLDDSL